MDTRCPSCFATIDLSGSESWSNISCSSCGSTFDVIDQQTVSYREEDTDRRIGRFQLEKHLGAGAFGEVWKALDTELQRHVAIKIPRREHLSSKHVDSLIHEARAAAKLKHSNIVPILEVGRHDDCVFIVSEFIDGLTLADWLTGAKLTASESAELCVKLSDALAHAHREGIVHRDIKPANILLDSDQEPFILDLV